MTKSSTVRKSARLVASGRQRSADGANALARARRDTERHPQRIEGWKTLAALLMAVSPQEAHKAAHQALKLAPDDPIVLDLAAQAEATLGNEPQAVDYLQKACALGTDLAIVHTHLGMLLYHRSKYDDALVALERAEALNPGDAETLYHKGLTLFRLHRYNAADAIFQRLLKRYPKATPYWNEAGNVKRDLGLLQEADGYYKKAEALTRHDPVPLGNRITAMHYRPDVTPAEIFEVCKEWQRRYAPDNPPERPISQDRNLNRRLRIGMFSDGFRKHPVGSMTIRMLESRNPAEFEIYAYTTNSVEDILTARIKKAVEHWAPISHLSDEEFAQRIRNDQIDILIDLCGYNRGNRMRVMALQPAPLLVKWVGGLINTTGVDTIDYLISDAIETPLGIDHLYTEKLIRMPDDYICFDVPPFLPDVGELPATLNGYITLGCFNNPLKVNDVLLAQWARIMHELPDSRLFLKGHQYASEEVCSRIRGQMLANGIEEDRLTLEGPSLQPILLNAYNRVDIALDPWPYSGGLTTCEAMLMGVPVVTLPGPTFAGRHSATHVVNAGMPELVVNDWDEYIGTVVGLANDIENLTTIRQHLRDVLLKSPVCDGPRFAQNFSVAMRAIWQRYCEGKKPAALTMDTESRVQFEDENAFKKIEIHAPVTKTAGSFDFSFQGRIVTVDHGALLVNSPQFASLRSLGTFTTLVFDPSGQVDSSTFAGQPDITVVQQSALGNGQQGTLFLYMDPALTGTLEPVDYDSAIAENQLVARLPVTTHRLDDINGLERVDWLLLDHRHDNVILLENGSVKLQKALLVQVRIASGILLRGQSRFEHIVALLSTLGFELYRIDGTSHHDYLASVGNCKSNFAATRMTEYALLFVPTQARLEQLLQNEREKLAFILHTVYGIKDFTYHVLALGSSERAMRYLESPNVGEKTISTKKSRTAVPNRSPEGPIAYTIPNTPAMSERETKLLKKYLRACRSYFEFGSGGSSKLAASIGVAVNGVESDRAWLQQLQRDIGPHNIRHVDIGPTREWGYPVDRSAQDRFPLYSAAIHDSTDSYDFILVDGRFRVACALQSARHILQHGMLKEAAIFIHDFWGRNYYQPVLRFLDEIESVDTAAVFRVKPDIDLKELKTQIAAFSNDFR